MISIAIPTYNYNVYPLVREIDKQVRKTGIEYEILVYDDASTHDFNLSDLLKDFEHVVYKKFFENKGRIAMRRHMASDAAYNYLLFMDADVFPSDRFFFVKLLKVMTQPADVYFGGITVTDRCADLQKILRWKFGKYRESRSLQQRQKDVYNSVISGSLLINKEVFLVDTENFKDLKRYGLDSVFAYNLQQNNRKVIHYHNPVVHLGLEKNAEFLRKTRRALETYRFLTIRYGLHELNRITRQARKLNQIIPRFVWQAGFKVLSPLLLANLTGKRPSLFLFDIYKVLYYNRLK